MPGTIIVPTTGLIRHTEFAHSLERLVRPEGTRVHYPTSGSVVTNLNRAIRMLPSEHEWVWLLGDDHVFDPHLLSRLLEHDAPIVVPLCAKRSAPYRLVCGGETTTFDEHTGREYPALEPLALEDVPAAPFTVELSGTAGMLIRRQVLRAIGDPWFESTDGLYLNEDFTFCQKARAHGFEILCDPEAWLGHIGSMRITPGLHDGELVLKLDYGDPHNPFILGEQFATVRLG